MKISVKKAKLTDHQCHTLVVFAAKAENKAKVLGSTDKELQLWVSQLGKDKDFSGDKKEGVLFRNINKFGARNVLMVGLGDLKKLDLEGIRAIAATTYNRLKSSKAPSAALLFESLVKASNLVTETAQALTEGILLTTYDFSDYKFHSNKKKKEETKLETITLLVTGTLNIANANKGVETGTILAESQNFTRWLGDHPGNLMTPEILANEAVKAAKGTSLKVTVWDKARIKKEKMGGLLGVSLGSDKDPRFIILEYNGGGKKRPVAFVGKGLTFDSGGISIKPSAGMEEMKYDMCGGAAVIGALLAIARLKLKVNVMGFVPSTENMPGPGANKPGDIIVARNGKSMEVLNTDAEGRLILSDALVYASEQKPAAIFDAATLTGAIVVALGNTHTGVFTRDQKLLGKIKTAAATSGEWVWPMPLVDFHAEDIKGTHADIANISSFKGAGSSTAAAFLEHFVEEGIPWAHFDIAGTAWNTANRLPYCPAKGASGVMVRTFVELAKMY